VEVVVAAAPPTGAPPVEDSELEELLLSEEPLSCDDRESSRLKPESMLTRFGCLGLGYPGSPPTCDRQMGKPEERERERERER